ncbi:MAG TPA: twin-arginine translocase subunit TatC [Bacteroidota bacterium]|nr:twin-arginine translocase subunit TatC [Bacteroidota bacterium]
MADTPEESGPVVDEERETTYETDDQEMSFFEHLEELRWRIVKAAMGSLVGIVICGIFSDWIVNTVILRPSRLTTPPLNLINTVPYGQITFYMMCVIVAGLVISTPWILYELWQFVRPGLLPKERRYISGIVTYTSICFFAGVAFAYFIMLPYMLQFFATFGTTSIQNLVSINEYMSFVLQLILLSGLVFELPMISYFLARFGIITPAFMRRYWRHAIVLILFIAAVVTPTTDPITMTVFSLPMFALYEISIFVAKIAKRKRDAAAAGEPGTA